MKHGFLIVSMAFLVGTTLGILVANVPQASAFPADESVTPDEVTFIVSVDEVAENYVFGERFSGRFEKVVTMSDGSKREIVLTPMEKDGRLVVKFQDGQGHTYMGPNGWTYNDNLLVNLRNYDQLSWSRNQ